MARAASPAARRPARNDGLPRESDLWDIWEGQRFPRGRLTGRGGQPFRVIYRGRAGTGPGPDFRDAVIAGPDGLLSGDVELHVRASDFRRHGHQRDGAYRRVALHVVLIDDDGRDTVLPGGGRAPVAVLRGAHLDEWLLRPARGQEPCRTAVQRLGAGGVAAALDRLGMMRFRRKSAAARRRLAGGESVDQALWQGILEALGYGGDRDAFAQLAVAVPWDRVRAEVTGLAPQAAGTAAHTLLAAAYERKGNCSPPARPGNTPRARLQAASVLAGRFSSGGPRALLEAGLIAGKGERELLRSLTVPRLLGRGRSIEILANAVLPVLAAAGLERQAEAAFAALPLSARYGVVGHLHRASGPAVSVNTRRQQGMLYLLGQYCAQGGCGRCPLS